MFAIFNILMTHQSETTAQHICQTRKKSIEIVEKKGKNTSKYKKGLLQGQVNLTCLKEWVKIKQWAE